MSYYDDIYEHAVDNHYLVTTADAEDLGIPVVELGKLSSRGRLERLGNGVYRLARHVPSEADPYAVAVARVGRDAYLWGESVVELLGLAPTTPGRVWVATPHRVRKALPEGVVVVRAGGQGPLDSYDGVPGQRVADAIRACAGRIMPERLRDAMVKGRKLGYVTAREERRLMEEMGWQ
ncbi:MAG: type IV toxin-antitoxin system AbiEi family antitoxin domain-containing protein [Coriobacteriales bacterium]|nr:type IV toxin-antitoxin system AbiEi family antitoxin domain-containing protein [Coriobacteriales bacterium]